MADDDARAPHSTLTRGDVRAFVATLRRREFCFDSPSDFGAGVEAMANLVEAHLPESDRAGDGRAGGRHSA